jgi:hypothetical protein
LVVVFHFDSSLRFNPAHFESYGNNRFHDMVVNTSLEKVSANQVAAGQIPAFPGALAGATLVTSDTSAINSVPDGINDVYTRYTYEYVDIQGRVINRANNTYADDESVYDARNFVRYCEFPGQRLLRNVKFEVNGGNCH